MARDRQGRPLAAGAAGFPQPPVRKICTNHRATFWSLPTNNGEVEMTDTDRIAALERTVAELQRRVEIIEAAKRKEDEENRAFRRQLDDVRQFGAL